MRKITSLLFLSFIIIILLVAGNQLILPKLLSLCIAKQLNADVKIEKAALNIKEGIRIKGIAITDRRGLQCNIESAIITPLPPRRSIYFKFENAKLSYPDSKIINSIANTLSLKSSDTLRFDFVKGRLHYRGGEVIIENLSAEGNFIKLFADATITNRSKIDCSLKMFLSGTIIEDIPESTRKIFFKKDGAWSKVELYITGSMDSPSINFSTDLFKLVVR